MEKRHVSLTREDAVLVNGLALAPKTSHKAPLSACAPDVVGQNALGNVIFMVLYLIARDGYKNIRDLILL